MLIFTYSSGIRQSVGQRGRYFHSLPPNIYAVSATTSTKFPLTKSSVVKPSKKPTSAGSFTCLCHESLAPDSSQILVDVLATRFCLQRGRRVFDDPETEMKSKGGTQKQQKNHFITGSPTHCHPPFFTAVWGQTPVVISWLFC